MMNKKKVLDMMRYCILFTSIFILQCSHGTYFQGQRFPELADPESTGTILMFYMENLEMYQSRSSFFDDLEETERLINRLNINLNLLQEQYPSLRIRYIDISQKSHTTVAYQIYHIPTIILFNRTGHEVRRWQPVDFGRGGGTRWEMKKIIDKLQVQLQ